MGSAELAHCSSLEMYKRTPSFFPFLNYGHQKNLVLVEKDINKFTTSLVNAWVIGRKR